MRDFKIIREVQVVGKVLETVCVSAENQEGAERKALQNADQLIPDMAEVEGEYDTVKIRKEFSVLVGNIGNIACENREDAGKILDNMKRKHDAYCGISWDTIDYYVDENGHSKVELEESSFMELVSELADALLREKYNGVIDVECGIEIRYSEKAQDIFNEYYDLFETILNEMGIQKSSNNTSVELIPKARYEDLLKSLVCEVFEGCLDEEEKLKEVIVKVLDTYTEEKTDA